MFCSDMTFDATLNPVVYEGGIPVFIDTEADSWNMDPIALEKAFTLYPEVKLVVMAHLYGFPAKVDEIKRICEKHGALLIEDAAEAMGATVNGKQCGSFGDYAAILEEHRPEKGDLPALLRGAAGSAGDDDPHRAGHRSQLLALRPDHRQRTPCAPRCALTAKPFTAQRRGSPAPRKFWKFWQSITPRAAPSGSPCHMQPMYRLHECVGRERKPPLPHHRRLSPAAFSDVGADIFSGDCVCPATTKCRTAGAITAG